MKPEDVIPGSRVKYSPSPGHEFVGMVAEKPWQLGGGQWVTKLVDMEEGYGQFTGKVGDKSHTVFAASLSAMRLAGGTVPRPSTVHPETPDEHRCNICGGLVHFDGTPPEPGNWGGRT